MIVAFRSRLRGVINRLTGKSDPTHPPTTKADRASRVLPTGAARPKISYEPMKDGNADPGEVVWTWVAYEEDPSQGKDRPALIIGRIGTQVVGLMLTTKSHGGPDYLAIGTGSWDAQGRPSWIRLDRVLRLDPDAIRREGAVLERARYDKVIAAFRTTS